MKVDVTKIKGYADMTPEEKIEALEGFDVETDYSGYVRKDMFDKTASELAGVKKQLKERMTEDEVKKAEEAKEREELESKYEALLHETAVSKNKAELLSLGYDEKLAKETAEAMADGDTEKVMANQRKHLEAFEKKVRADILKNTPSPVGEGGSNTMTLDKFRQMSPSERYDFSQEHPEEYKELYGGN